MPSQNYNNSTQRIGGKIDSWMIIQRLMILKASTSVLNVIQIATGSCKLDQTDGKIWRG